MSRISYTPYHLKFTFQYSSTDLLQLFMKQKSLEIRNSKFGKILIFTEFEKWHLDSEFQEQNSAECSNIRRHSPTFNKNVTLRKIWNQLAATIRLSFNRLKVRLIWSGIGGKWRTKTDMNIRYKDGRIHCITRIHLSYSWNNIFITIIILS